MNEDVLSFEKVKVDRDLIDEIWQFNPRDLENLDGIKLSIYAVALAQYLIYFASQRNKDKAESIKLTRYIDRTVSLILSGDKELLKKYKTKTAATDYIISTNIDLMEAQTKLEAIQLGLMQIDGIDKSISELIATIKRELTRRENELYSIRQERKN
jgi:hypothetical protein